MKFKLLGILLVLAAFQGFASDVKFDAKKDYVYLDLRTMAEACVAHLDSALSRPSLLVPYDANFEDKVASLSEYKNKDIILFCRSGYRAGLARDILEDAGFCRLENIKTLENAKNFEDKFISRKKEQNAIIKKHIPLYIERAGLKEDIISLIENKNAGRLNEIFTDKFIENPDANLRKLLNLILAYMNTPEYMSSYYLSELHPFYPDIVSDSLKENLKSDYADFKSRQKETMQMELFYKKLLGILGVKVEMKGFVGD